MPKGCRLVSAIGFNCDDTKLAACDMAEKITVHLFDLTDKDSMNPIADVTINQKVMHLQFNHFDANLFATVGKDHTIVCSIESKLIKKNKGKGTTSMSSVAWLKS